MINAVRALRCCRLGTQPQLITTAPSLSLITSLRNFSSTGQGESNDNSGGSLGRHNETKGAMSSYLKSSAEKAGDNSKPWMKNLKQKNKSHAQYFAADDPEPDTKAPRVDDLNDVDSVSEVGDDTSFRENKRRRGRRGRGSGGNDDEEDKALDKMKPTRDNEDSTRGISPTILNMIDDWSHFEELGRKGLTVDTSEMDDLDAFMSLIYAEAAKTSDGTVWGTMEEGADERGRGGKRSKVRIPHPRTTRQLARTTVPQICPEKGGPPESEGFKLAVEAWKVLAKNPYYTLQEKKEMCNRIARKANWYLDDSRGLYDADLEEAKQPKANKRRWSKQDIQSEMIWKENWSKGLKGLQEEEALAQKLEEEELLRRQKNYVGQDETDWNVTAVQDEDELFK